MDDKTRRFYFHLDCRVARARDEEGRELPSLDAARHWAIENIRSILKADIDEGLIDLRGRIEVTDAHGEVQAVVRFAEAVDLHLGSIR